MIQQLKNFTLGICVVAMITAFAAKDSQAQVSKAFRITGSGIIPEGVPLPGEPPRAHWIAGNATHSGVPDVVADTFGPFDQMNCLSHERESMADRRLARIHPFGRTGNDKCFELDLVAID